MNRRKSSKFNVFADFGCHDEANCYHLSLNFQGLIELNHFIRSLEVER